MRIPFGERFDPRPRHGRIFALPFILALSFTFVENARGGLIIEFDYSYDGSGFFNDPSRRAALEFVADSVNRWVDSLLPIVQSGSNTWTGQVVRPDTGFGVFIPGSQLNIPADTVRVYVGSRDLGGPPENPHHPAATEKNGVIVNGDPAWVQLVKWRGQTPGPPFVDYGPWGASIAFDSRFNWYFGIDPNGLGSTQMDFFSAAAHELLHVLGFGVAESFSAQISGDGHFVGPKAVQVGSPNNPNLQLDSINDHWLPGTHSTIAGVEVQSTITPFLSNGQRLRMTDLDAAAVDDVGWEAALTGDVDRDRDIDFVDAFTLTNSYGNTGTAAWSQGDNDGDGDVDFSDAFAQVNNYGASYATASTYEDNEGLTLVYNQATGEVTLELPAGERIKSLSLQSDSGMLYVGSADWLALAAESNTFSVDTAAHQGFATYTVLGGSFLANDGYLIGTILDSGLTEAFLREDLTIYYGIEGSAGTWIGDLSVVVPEPASFVAALVGWTVGCLGLRRRASCRCCNFMN
jgi:hypothetical protein